MKTEKIEISEARKILRQFQLIMITVVALIVGGSTFYHYVEDWRWLDAIYFSFISLATVGYGDFTPKTDLGKIFTIFYLIVGIALFAALLNNLIKSRIAKQSIKSYEQKKSEK